MSKRSEKAVQLHRQGYNCAQAVACAFCDKVGMDEATMFRLTEGFGLGMGGMQGVCGAVSACVLLAGLQNSAGALTSPPSKLSTHRLSKQLLDAFREKNGSIICRELKGADTGTVLRSCPGCVEDAALLAEQLLFPEK